MYELSTSEENGFRWSYRGRIPSAQEFFEDLWHDALAQFIVSTTESDEALGVVRIYEADFENGTAKIAPVVAPSASMGVGAEAGLLIVNYAFWNWDFRKLYIEVPSYALELMGRSTQDRLAQEACLREHDYHQGRYWDRHVFALYREDFAEVPDRLWGRLLYQSDQAR